MTNQQTRTDETRRLVDQFYAALRGRDREKLESVLAEDVDWVAHSPAHVLAFTGWRRGRTSVVESLRLFRREFELEDFRQEVKVVDGPRAAVMTDSAFRQRASGRILRILLVDFLRFENGKLAEFRQFMNSFDLVEQVLGREIDVGVDLSIST